MKSHIVHSKWQWYSNHPISSHAEGFYQKKVWQYDEDKFIHAEVIQYPEMSFPNGNTIGRRWEVDIQIPDDFGILERAMNLKFFTYDKLDWVTIELEIMEVIGLLAKGRNEDL